MDQNRSNSKNKISNPSEDSPHVENNGLEEPVTKQLPKLQLTIIAFAVFVLILITLAWSFNFLDLFS